MADLPRIDVIIPAYNEEKIIDECLRSLVSQTYSNFSAIIVDDASTDSTRQRILEFSERYPQKIQLREFGKVGPGKARNLAAKESSADILAFMDADCVATVHWLTELERSFTDSDVGSGGGPHLAPPSSSHFQLRVEKFFKLVSPSIGFYKNKHQANLEIFEVEHNPLCNVAYRREVFAQAGGFREDLFPGEDVEMDFKVKAKGLRITYNPKALVYHHRPETIQQFKKVMHAYGRAQGKLVREYGLKRRIQWVGMGVLLGVTGLIVVLNYSLGKRGLIFSAFILFLVFLERPRISNTLGIWLNSLQWLNGFIEGLLTNRSEPPGQRKT